MSLLFSFALSYFTNETTLCFIVTEWVSRTRELPIKDVDLW